MKTLKRISALLLALLCLAGCGSGGARSLTANIEPARLEAGMEEGDAAALAGFSLDLLRETWESGNALVSPLSVLSALGMTANGARGETLEQMEAVLGLPAERLNGALAAWAAELPKEKDCRVDLANSVWIRDGGSFEADQDFLEAAAKWYRAEVFASPFDAAAVRDVNGWVEKNTHGMIPEILDELQEATVLVLVNALALEAEWEEIYETDQVWENEIFTTEDGAAQPVTLMYSSEGRYLKDQGAQGFLKFYKGGRWAFAALLPDEGTALEDYLDSLTGERLHEVLAGAEETLVYAAIPKFKSAYGVELNGALKALGMTDAFDAGRADLSGLGRSELGPLFISRVLHKTYIEVDEKGTKAGAATAVIADCGADMPGSVPEVHLDRPFLYMLVDTETNLPAFIGVVTDMS
jgi:serpin B